MRSSKKRVKVLVLRTAGTNCDRETVFAFASFGADARPVHINQLVNRTVSLNTYHILAIPGGFTYGDDIESGRILANELRLKLGGDICRFVAEGKLIIGICNGFQALVKSGILPGPLNAKENEEHDCSSKVTLISNDSGKFEDRWTYLRVEQESIWTRGLDEIVYFPVAHGEGKFVVRQPDILEKLCNNKQIVFRYCSSQGTAAGYPGNPNGSLDDIAGITDTTGRILGLMPHPERHMLWTQHPRWTRLAHRGPFGHGAKIFQNAVHYIKENVL